MTLLNNNQIKNIQLEILKTLTDYCDKNNLICYLSGGTMLGAIRHKGFIPWDDDIDLNMPRPDFEKLISLRNAEDFPEHLKLLDCYNSKDYIYPFVKIIDDRTYINEDEDYNDRTSGIWLDIFPMDSCPEDDDEYKKLCKKMIFLKHCIYLSSIKFFKGVNIFKAIVKIPFQLISKIIGGNRIANYINRIAKQYKYGNTKYTGCLIWGYGTRERFLSAGYEKPVKAEFEGYEFDIPSNYDVYLRALFGDYMTLPPIEERVGHNIIAYLKDGEEIEFS